MWFIHYSVPSKCFLLNACSELKVRSYVMVMVQLKLNFPETSRQRRNRRTWLHIQSRHFAIWINLIFSEKEYAQKSYPAMIWFDFLFFAIIWFPREEKRETFTGCVCQNNLCDHIKSTLNPNSRLEWGKTPRRLASRLYHLKPILLPGELSLKWT